MLMVGNQQSMPTTTTKGDNVSDGARSFWAASECSVKCRKGHAGLENDVTNFVKEVANHLSRTGHHLLALAVVVAPSVGH